MTFDPDAHAQVLRIARYVVVICLCVLATTYALNGFCVTAVALAPPAGLLHFAAYLQHRKTRSGKLYDVALGGCMLLIVLTIETGGFLLAVPQAMASYMLFAFAPFLIFRARVLAWLTSAKS